MLKSLRKRTKTIVWAVVIAFVAWGGYAVGVQFQEASRSPGRIFGKEVSFRDYLVADRAVQIFQLLSKKDTPPNPEEIEARTWEFLVLSHAAKAEKIGVSDEEVREEIKRLLGGIPQDGAFEARYFQWVRGTLRQEPREFEKQIQEYLRIQKFLKAAREETAEPREENFKKWYRNLIVKANIQVHKSST